ncbi:MAG TPA: efflux transporter outer membrane subunit [Casimicrobiaceae bacterium]|nr:efflux transporter outer membrane subunit [Casimicrobiaceae bacterium]
MRRSGVALVAIAALIAGCSLQPVYERPSAPVSGTYPTGDAYKSSTAGSSTTRLPAVDIGWREFLTDLRLQRLVEIGLANNRDLRVAALNVAQTQAQYRIQRAALFPQISGFADSSSSRTPASLSATGNATVTHDYSVGVSASWEIDFFGRLQSLNDQALQQYFSTAQARKAADILLVSEITDQYLTLLADDELLAVTQGTLETAQASYKLTVVQFNAGTGSELSVRQAETVVEQARANYSAQLRGRAQAENALVLLIGQPLPADLPPPAPLNAQTILADIPADLPSDLLVRRPDIMEAEATLRGANANIGAARAAFFPTISLTGSLGTASSALGGLFKAGSLAWSFLPSLSLPIFEAGKLQASLDVATVQKDINVAQYEKTIQTAFREVSDGLAARGTYDDQVASLERLTEAQQRRLDLSDMRFRNGVDPYLTVLTAQTDLYNAQQTLVSARLARLTNLVDLYRSLGGGWIEHTGDAPRPAEDVGSIASPSPSPWSLFGTGDLGRTLRANSR